MKVLESLHELDMCFGRSMNLSQRGRVGRVIMCTRLKTYVDFPTLPPPLSLGHDLPSGSWPTPFTTLDIAFNTLEKCD